MSVIKSWSKFLWFKR